MKRHTSLAAVCLSLSLLLATGGRVLAQAANNPIISVDENGNGTIQFPGAPAIPLPGVLAPDPGPGGLPSALTYNLLGPPSLVAGDVILIEPGAGAQSDLIRFNPAGTGSPGYPASLVFYSDLLDGATDKADTGFPTSLNTNVVTLPEVGPEGMNGTFNYTPTSGQPGFVAGFGVTYNFFSDVSAPEPASLMLTALGGLIGIYFVRRSRAQRVKA